MPMFESQTPEVIKARILERMGTTLQTREGSFTSDMVSPVAFELWRVLMTLDELVSAFYVDENSGGYLDKHASLLGIARKEGTRAYAVVRFTGRDGVTIPAGTVFLTAEGLEYTLMYEVTLADGVGEGYLQAVNVGEAYNADAGEICQVLRSMSGLTGFVNEAAVGGTDPETDADLFARIDTRRKNPGTSGNEAHYIEWALECDGVGGVKVTRLWNGPGTVRVLLAGYDRKPVDEAVVTAAAEYIESVRPVGAEVTVVSAEGQEISVSATVNLNGAATMEEVRQALSAALEAYLQELADEYFKSSGVYEYPVYYNKIAALLMGITGVADFTDLTVNGGTANVVVEATSVPVLGEVVLA